MNMRLSDTHNECLHFRLMGERKSMLNQSVVNDVLTITCGLLGSTLYNLNYSVGAVNVGDCVPQY